MIRSTVADRRVQPATGMASQAPLAAAKTRAAKAAQAAEARVSQTEQQPRAAATLSGDRSDAGAVSSAEADEERAGGGTEKPGYSSDAATHPFAVQHGSSISPTAASRVQSPSSQDAYGGDSDILQDELVNAISPAKQTALPAGTGVTRACVMHAPKNTCCSCFCDLSGYTACHPV